MRDEYDFSGAHKNPSAKKFKKQIKIDLDCEFIDYFKGQPCAMGIPYQQLINLYLADYVAKKRQRS